MELLKRSLAFRGLSDEDAEEVEVGDGDLEEKGLDGEDDEEGGPAKEDEDNKNDNLVVEE